MLFASGRAVLSVFVSFDFAASPQNQMKKKAPSTLPQAETH
jgi:hypothetical protein